MYNLSFSAWGERRPAGFDPNGTIPSFQILLNNYALTHGFTGHEQDDFFGFVNMKGRIYDAALGRFMSADPFVQAPNNTQSYNRYSYVLNNPLSYTDPSGYIADKILEGIRTVVAIATAIIAPHIGLPALIALNTVTSAVLTYAATGSLEAAFTSGVISGITTGLSAGLAGAVKANFAEGVVRNLAHGVAQGTVSVLQGGKFRSGFIGGFVGHAARGLGGRLGFGEVGSEQGRIGRTVVVATVSGLISEHTGGKFANGAITAAFVHLFNAEVTATKLNLSIHSGLTKVRSAFQEHDLFSVVEGILPKGVHTVSIVPFTEELYANPDYHNALMVTSPDTIYVNLGHSAYNSVSGVLASAIAHEFVHIVDHKNSLGGLLSPGVAMDASEVRAYQWQIDNQVNLFGLNRRANSWAINQRDYFSRRVAGAANE